MARTNGHGTHGQPTHGGLGLFGKGEKTAYGKYAASSAKERAWLLEINIDLQELGLPGLRAPKEPSKAV